MRHRRHNEGRKRTAQKQPAIAGECEAEEKIEFKQQQSHNNRKLKKGCSKRTTDAYTPKMMKGKNKEVKRERRTDVYNACNETDR